MSKLKVELGLVLALSLGASAVYSIVSLIAKLTAPTGLAGSSTTINGSLATREWLDLTYQLLDFAFGLAPVALVAYLLWMRSGLSPRLALQLGGGARTIAAGAARGLVLAALIGVPGLGLYLASRALGLSAKVIPADLTSHWWVPVVLLLMAAKAALLEETVVVAFLLDTLDRLGVRPAFGTAISAVLRGAYHLYQGIGGFVGNLVMGLVFAGYFRRLRAKADQTESKVGKFAALWPLVVAHFVLDAIIFVGYSLLNLSHVLP